MTLNDDKGICEGVSIGHLNDPSMVSFRRQSPPLFLFIACSHLFGAGVYVASMQKKLGKGANNFTTDEIFMVRDAFSGIDLYELGLNTLGIDPQSNNKAVIDSIINTCIQSSANNCSNLIYEDDMIKYV